MLILGQSRSRARVGGVFRAELATFAVIQCAYIDRGFVARSSVACGPPLHQAEELRMHAAVRESLIGSNELLR